MLLFSSARILTLKITQANKPISHKLVNLESFCHGYGQMRGPRDLGGLETERVKSWWGSSNREAERRRDLRDGGTQETEGAERQRDQETEGLERQRGRETQAVLRRKWLRDPQRGGGVERPGGVNKETERAERPRAKTQIGLRDRAEEGIPRLFTCLPGCPDQFDIHVATV